MMLDYFNQYPMGRANFSCIIRHHFQCF